MQSKQQRTALFHPLLLREAFLTLHWEAFPLEEGQSLPFFTYSMKMCLTPSFKAEESALLSKYTVY